MKSIYRRFAALTLLVVSLPVFALLAGEAEDGGPLHDQFCLGCHVSMFGGDGSTLYLRGERRVNSIEGLMGQVAFCNEQTKVGNAKNLPPLKLVRAGADWPICRLQ